MTRAIAALTAIAAAFTASPAVASSSYLHVAEARLMNHRLAIKLERKTGWPYKLGACHRVSARRVDCAFSLSHRDAEGLLEVTSYVTRVAKRGNVTLANATATGTVEG